MNGMMGTSGRHVMFVGRCTKKEQRRNGCARASVKVSAARTLVADASKYILGTDSGHPRRKAVARVAERRHKRRNARGGVGNSQLFDEIDRHSLS